MGWQAKAPANPFLQGLEQQRAAGAFACQLGDYCHFCSTGNAANKHATVKFHVRASPPSSNHGAIGGNLINF
jgi:hypothetical protein